MPATGGAAANLLKAMMPGSLPELEAALDHAARFSESQTPASTYDAERLELLGAIAGYMRVSLTRLRQRRTGRLDGFEAGLSLLRHLAQIS